MSDNSDDVIFIHNEESPYFSHVKKFDPYLTVAVAGQLGDEADMVVSDLYHLLTNVVLWADTALCAGPPGQETAA